jgi:5,10-methylenetetrahydromethanopterin reductase
LIKKFGIGFSNTTPLHDILEYSELAEKNGLSFWLNEGYHNRSSPVLMSAIASRTKYLELGLGIVSPVLRHPFLVAMDAGTLDEISHGRLSLGIGLAASGAKRQNIDVLSLHPVELMRDSAHIIRELIAGETVTSTKMFRASSEGVKLGFDCTRKVIPLYLGAMHRQMLELGGRLFDGVLLNYACSLAYAKFAIDCIKQGARNREINSPLDILAFILISIAEKHDNAIEASKKYLPHYLQRAYPISLDYAGVTREEISPILEALRHPGSASKVTSLVSDELVSKLTISGTPEECTKDIRKFSDAGVNQVIAEQIMGPDPKRAIELIGSEVAPKFVEKKTPSVVS